MKLKNIIKTLSIVLVFLIVVVALPLNVIAASPEEHETDYGGGTANTSREQNATEELTETEPEETETENNDLEFETEIVFDEIIEGGNGIIAPPFENIGETVDPNVVPLGIVDGVYQIENVGNPDFFIAVEGDYAVEGYRLLQKAYSGSTPLTNFTRSSLFKISKVAGSTDRYIIRSMLNNRLSIGVQGSKLVTTIIEADDSQVPASSTFTITYESGGFVIKPYGSSTVVAAPNSNASGDAGIPNSYISVSLPASAGTRGKWTLTKYNGSDVSGFTVTRTAGMGDGLIKGSTPTMWIKGWSTIIGANTPYLSVTSAYNDIATSSWNATSGGAVVTYHKCGDFQMKAEIRSGSSQTATYSKTYTYTVIPDIVGDTGFVQNVATGKYMEVESASTSNGGIVQQWSFHTQSQMKWIFELDGNGYFKITCVNSSKYLGVDSSDTTKVKQYSSVTDYTLWKISETSSGNYKFSCKALESSGKVLCVSTATSGDGADLTILVYVDDSNYRDEWKIYTDLSTYYGVLQYWNSDSESVGYWNSEPSIYEENMVSSSQFFFETAIISAKTQWSSALGITFSAGEEDDSDIKVYGLTPNDYYNETGKNWPSSRTGFCVSGKTAKGYAVYQGNIKRIKKMTRAEVYIIYRSASPRTEDETKKTAVHEFGHALGYSGHSPTTTDVMYGVAHSQYILSTSEINHIAQIYALMH